jgi:CBS domain-containing protein
MRWRVISVTPETPAADAIDLIVENDVSGLPVVDGDGNIVGVFSEIDRIQQGNIEGKSVSQLMTQRVVTVDVQDSLVEVARAFKENTVRRLPVMDKGAMVGIIGLRDLVRYIREAERTLEGIAPVVRNCELFKPECQSHVD